SASSSSQVAAGAKASAARSSARSGRARRLKISTIRRSRSEDATMTAETSNARGETYTFDMIEDAWGDAVPLTKPYFNRFRARLETLRQSAAPPPAAARVDVRGLVTLAEQWERDAGGCR